MAKIREMEDEVFFKWLPDYGVNIKSIDNQHQELANILNRLFVAVASREHDKAVARILDSLIEYTETHFAFEERLMEQANYAELESHKQEHKKLIEKLDQLCTQYVLEKQPIHFELLTFLKKWLKEHISGVDKKYSAVLQCQGDVPTRWEDEAKVVFKSMMEQTGRRWRI